MRNDTLTVWLEAVPEDAVAIRSGMLCRRHADAMIVPRGWSLDDRRESTPRLFRVGETAAQAAPATRRKRSKTLDPTEQLSFGDDPDAPPTVEPGELVTVADLKTEPAPHADPDETQAIPWRFVYDSNDDLGGILAANSPLLSRAFRGGAKRPRNTDQAKVD
jgi:hypothetical protein